MRFFDPVWMKSNPNKKSKALDAVSKASQEELVMIVCKAFFPEVRRKALWLLKDPESLSAVCNSNKRIKKRIFELSVSLEWFESKHIIELLLDEDLCMELIFYIFKEGYRILNYDLKREDDTIKKLVSNIHNTEKLKYLVTDSDYNTAINCAFSKAIDSFSDEELYGIITSNNKLYPQNSILAVENIKSQIILIQIVENCSDIWLRTKAVQNIKQEDVLIKYANDKTLPDEIRACALCSLSTQEDLEKIVWSSESLIIRERAAEKIKDKEKLKQIRDTFPELGEALCGKLGHIWEFSHYKPYGNGGKYKVYSCKYCSETMTEPYEWSSADSV